MKQKIFSVSLLVAILAGIYQGIDADTRILSYVQISCSGVAVARTDIGTLETVYVDKNLPGCIGPTDPIAMQQAQPQITYAQLNCSGIAVVRTGVGRLETIAVARNLPGCIGPISPVAMQDVTTVSTWSVADTGSLSPHQDRINLEYIAQKDGPLLDITSEDIGNYRIEKLKEQGVQHANPVYSVRIRNGASMKTNTEAYLIKNDTVVVDGTGTTWAKVQGAEVVVTDTQENTVVAQTGSRARGYTVRRWLRDPNPSDLVRIGQADQAYWSDIAHVNVAHTVNVREHPWYGSKILFVVTNKTPLYIVSTVDNWSEVMNDDRTLRGYIRSDFLVVDKAQRREPEPLLK